MLNFIKRLFCDHNYKESCKVGRLQTCAHKEKYGTCIWWDKENNTYACRYASLLCENCGKEIKL